MRLEAPWLDHPGTRAVMAALTGAGHRALFVGGCVRNTLMGRPVGDIDIATDARPEQVAALAEAAGLKAVPTGIDHGTVTLVAEGIPHEVTTFRRDVETDGRRAVVAFSDDIAEDAARRDFTMNALYATAEGTLHDPLGGLPDLRAGRVRFIGDAATRIAEDGLRVLRFFRFMAIYGDPALGPDPESLAAVAAAADALDPVSRERIGGEIEKLLDAADPAPAVAAMAASGVLGRALPGADPKALAPLVHLERAEGIPPAWQRRLAALGAGPWQEALRLANRDARRLEQIGTCLGEDLPDGAAAERFGAEVAEDAALVRAAMLGTPPAPGWRQRIAEGAGAVFPVRAADLMPAYGPGPELGAALARLHRHWVATGFALSREQLLEVDRGDAR